MQGWIQVYSGSNLWIQCKVGYKCTVGRTFRYNVRMDTIIRWIEPLDTIQGWILVYSGLNLWIQCKDGYNYTMGRTFGYNVRMTRESLSGLICVQNVRLATSVCLVPWMDRRAGLTMNGLLSLHLTTPGVNCLNQSWVWGL